MNNITIELCAEDRKRLDNILEALKCVTVALCDEAGKPKATNSVKSAAKGLKAVAEKAEQAAATVAQPEPETPAEQPEPKQPETTPEPTPAADVPEVTTAELQSKVVQLVGAGKKDAARAIVMEYAKSVGEIPADKRAEVLERLNALEG